MADDKFFSSFACQRCSKSLRLDESLNSFSDQTSAELNCELSYYYNLHFKNLTSYFQYQYIPIQMLIWNHKLPVLITMFLLADYLTLEMEQMVLC